MRITFVLPFASLSGGVRVVATYARLLKERGHGVFVVSQPYERRQTLKSRIKDWLGITPEPRPAQTPLLDFLGPDHVVLERQRPVEPSDLPDADVIVATWWSTAEWIARLPEAKGRKFYLLQDYEVFSDATAEGVIASYQLPLHKIAVSDYIRDEIAAHHNVTGIDVVPNAVDAAQFSAPPRGKAAAPTVGFLYSGSRRKNVRLAIDVLEAAKARIPDLRAHVFGSGPTLAELPVPDWAVYEANPTQDRIPQIYAACDVWLFTSDREGYGLPILEAMACRTPVLATPAGAAPQLIDGVNGRLLTPKVDTFTDAIAAFAAMDDATWRIASDAALDTAQRHNWDSAVDRLEALFRGADFSD